MNLFFRILTIFFARFLWLLPVNSPNRSSDITMLRNGASRLLFRPITASAARPATNIQRTTTQLQWNTQFGSLASRRPQLSQLRPSKTAILRRSLTDKQKEAEARYAKEEIKPTPETVSTTSTTHPMFSEVGVENPTAKDADMTAGLKHDVVRCGSLQPSEKHQLIRITESCQGDFHPQ